MKYKMSAKEWNCTFNPITYKVYFIMELMAVSKTSWLPFSLLRVPALQKGHSAAQRCGRSSLAQPERRREALPAGTVPAQGRRGRARPALPPAAAAAACQAGNVPVLSADRPGTGISSAGSAALLTDRDALAGGSGAVPEWGRGGLRARRTRTRHRALPHTQRFPAPKPAIRQVPHLPSCNTSFHITGEPKKSLPQSFISLVLWHERFLPSGILGYVIHFAKSLFYIWAIHLRVGFGGPWGSLLTHVLWYMSIIILWSWVSWVFLLKFFCMQTERLLSTASELKNVHLQILHICYIPV